MSTENLDLIRRGYEAFGRGDISTVLGISTQHPLACSRAQPALW